MKSKRMLVSTKAETSPKIGEGARAEAATKESLRDAAAFIFNEQVWADPREGIGDDESGAFALDEDLAEGE